MGSHIVSRLGVGVAVAISVAVFSGLAVTAQGGRVRAHGNPGTTLGVLVDLPTATGTLEVVLSVNGNQVGPSINVPISSVDLPTLSASLTTASTFDSAGSMSVGNCAPRSGKTAIGQEITFGVSAWADNDSTKSATFSGQLAIKRGDETVQSIPLGPVILPRGTELTVPACVYQSTP